jgi:hypothetical protein
LLVPGGTELEDFIILSDHNRGEIAIGQDRIENRKRMINGTMRSYHIADKLNISLDWEMLPSRSHSNNPNFNAYGNAASGLTEYTADGGAGGVDIVSWYESNPGSFYMFLSYDKPQNFSLNVYENLDKYSDVLEVFISDFSYNVVKRGGTNHDLWNVSISLEEV